MLEHFDSFLEEELKKILKLFVFFVGIADFCKNFQQKSLITKPIDDLINKANFCYF